MSFEPPPKKKQLEVSSAVLHGLFENGKSALSEQFLRWKLWKKWDEYVGKTTADICEPVGYKRGTLYVWVKNSAWMQQMIFMIEPLRDKINERLGISYVRAIHLTLDRRAVPDGVEQQAELKSSIERLMGDTAED